MEENFTSEESSQQIISNEKNPDKQIELLKMAPLGTYWKRVCNNPEKNPTRINDYYHITKLQSFDSDNYSQITLGGERMQIDESCMFGVDFRATLYDFSFKRTENDVFYWKQIPKEEYEALRTKAINLYKIKSDEMHKRAILFQKFEEPEIKKLEFNDVMKLAYDNYQFIKPVLEQTQEAREYFIKESKTEELANLEVEFDKFRKQNRILVYSHKFDSKYPDYNLSFSIYEIDTTSMDFKPAHIDENGTGYVDGTPFEENGESFHYKVKSYCQSIIAKNYNRDFYETEFRTYFDDGNKNWRYKDPDGWRQYTALKNEFIGNNSGYRSSPLWAGDEYILIDYYHFNQLLELIKFTANN